MIDTKIANKVVLITGANHGIGASTAQMLADQGAKVFITYYLNNSQYTIEEMNTARAQGTGGRPLYAAMQQQSGESVVKKIRARGGTATACEFDLTEVNNITTLFDNCETQVGPVEILIINHTYDVFDTFDPFSIKEKDNGIRIIDTENIDHHFAVNTRAPALMMKEYLQRYLMRNAKWGRIIGLTTSIAHPRNMSYAASKNALVSYCLSAAKEMGKYGITVNIVGPGATQTGYITPEEETMITIKTPLGRLGTPEDVADIIVFLASEQAHWLTGQVIYASGGYNINR
jgi:3-oxoacyl-[acyl-carrier protein] reductase